MTNEEIAAELERLNEKATPGPLKKVALAHVVREPVGGSDHAEYSEADAMIFKTYRNNHAAIVSALRDVARMREAFKEQIARAEEANDLGIPRHEVASGLVRLARSALEPAR